MGRLQATVMMGLVLTVGPAVAQERTLQPNMPLQAAFRPGDAPHEYTFRVESKQWVEVLVEQARPFLTFAVRHPDGRSTWSAQRESSAHRLAAFPTNTAGVHTVVVRVLPRIDMEDGTYVIRLTTRPQTAAELSRAAVQAELGALDAKWQEASGQHDVATLVALSRPDSTHRYSSEDLDGSVSHDEFLALAKRNHETQRTTGGRSSYSDRTQRIEVSGGIAVVTARFVEHASSNAKSYIYPIESVRVWGKDATGWKVVSEQRRMVGRHRHTDTASGFPPRDVLSAYVGTFRNQQLNREVQFALDGDALVARWTFPQFARAPFTLTPVTDTTFEGFARDEITFVRSPDGKVREFIQTWEGPAFLFQRVDEGAAPATTKEP